MLRRLQVQESVYSVQKLEEEFKKKEEIMTKVMCEHPFILG